jgi:hypothetical protein
MIRCPLAPRPHRPGELAARTTGCDTQRVPATTSALVIRLWSVY